MIDQIKINRKKLSSDILLELERQLYRQSFFEFFKKAVTVLKPNDDWQFNWHHEYLCDILQKEAIRVNSRKIKKHDYLINIPPATTKSRLVSICFNAWVWACVSPHLTFLCISHNEELSIEFASETKDLIETDWYQQLFTVQIRHDKSAITNFKNTDGGSRVSFSLMAGITGFHGDFILIDDPHDSKNVSDIKVETAIRVYKETIYNRLKNPRVGLRLIIGQRVGDNDLSNYVISNNEDNKYFHICLPIELTDNVSPVSLTSNYTNGVLWNDRFPSESFSDLTTSELTFATQYLMQPQVQGGGIIKDSWFEIVETIPEDIVYHLFLDTAFTSNKNRDASAIMVAGMKNNLVYVKEVQEVFLEFPDLCQRIIEVASKEKPATKIYIEPKANGKTIIAQLKHSTLLNVVSLPSPQDSKIARINSITPKLETKRVKLLKGNWNEGFLYQCSGFPNSKRDDQVDTLYSAVDTLLKDAGKIHWYM